MGEVTMELSELVSKLSAFDDELTIYAQRPWTSKSKAIVAMEPDAGGLPNEAKANHYEYFLEIFVANEFLEGWLEGEGKAASKEQTCERLISYAINDA